MMGLQKCTLWFSQHRSFCSVRLHYNVIFMSSVLWCLNILTGLCRFRRAWQLLLSGNPGFEAVAFVKMCRALCVTSKKKRNFFW